MAQRVLASHEKISTASEPWLLLPHLSALRREGSYADFGHSTAAGAIDDFCKALPRGREDYFSAMHEFVLRVYEEAADENARYFLDKTPRYHLIVDEIIRQFPEAKFIFLWRNPLAVAASIVETWGRGKWNLHLFKVDLFEGMANLIQTCQRYADRVYAVRYEDLVTEPDKYWEGVFGYLDLSFDRNILDKLDSSALQGDMGDKIGTRLYSQVTKEPLRKWEKTLASPLRKAWCRHYLRWIGEERLAIMGYDQSMLLAELDALPFSGQRIGSDTVRFLRGAAIQFLEPDILRDKIKSLPEWSRIYLHK